MCKVGGSSKITPSEAYSVGYASLYTYKLRIYTNINWLVMTFEILHLSDLHFGNPTAHLRRSDLSKALNSLMSRIKAHNSLIIISGDVTFKGNKEGYREATEIFNEAIDYHKFDRSNILVCPGNHDIVIEKSGRPYFTSFDEWSASIRDDKKCTFANVHAQLIENDIGNFLLLNTAHHANHEMGLVDLPSVERLLEKLPIPVDAPPTRLRVAVAHHHFIPVLPGDSSTTRNAYPLIQLLEKYGFSALLHGHQHAMLTLSVGARNLQLSGVGSFGFSTPGYINSVAIYQGEGASISKEERYGLTLDASSGVVKIQQTN